MFDDFSQAMKAEGKTQKTVEAYRRSVQEYYKWYEESFGDTPEKLLAVNVSDYIAWQRTVRGVRGSSLNPKVAALKCYNRFLIDTGVQTELVVKNKHRDKVQEKGVTPSIVDQQEVDAFRQAILITNGVRDHAIVTVMAYAGLRISEALGLLLDEVDLEGKELLVVGKGNKIRIVNIGTKVVHAIREYLKVRTSDSPYLFVSRQSEKLDRSVVNKLCKRFSDKITPHILRHFYCSHALESGYRINEVANQAGHTNLKTTMIYLNPSRKEMKDKADKL